MNLRFIILFCLFCSLLIGSTFEVKQDGTGDFTTIQDGINYCTAGDTILVYPGTYFENLVILEKPITLGSLFLTTGDESYINQTILDGNYNDSVIRIEDTPAYYNLLVIAGFVIQHGNGYQYNAPYEPDSTGGGLYISESSLNIRNCLIQYNTCNLGGGGIALLNSFMNLSGCTIRFNQADIGAGGLLIGGMCSDVEFNDENLNNIYLNYSGCANDIFITSNSPFQAIILDTFTVINPDDYYYYIYPSSTGAGIPLPNKFSVDIQHGYIEQVDHDLYVSPYGNNDNSGISDTEPLKSIAYALIKIRSDSLEQRAIHIEDGIYSSSLNNQKFPLHIKSFIDIIGESTENTILDRECAGGLIFGNDGQKCYQISNISLMNANDWPSYMATINSNVLLSNIHNSYHTEDINSSRMYGSFVINFCDVEFDCLLSENNQDAGNIYCYSPYLGTYFRISNSVFRNNRPIFMYLGCLQIWCSRTTTLEDSLVVNVINTEITDNLNTMSEPVWLPATSAILIDWQTKLNLVNSTIGNNECLYEGAAIQLDFESEANIVNSIVYGNIPYNICLDGREGANTLNAWNSLIEGGVDGILQLDYNYINWDDETMKDEDPLWLGENYEYTYALSADSPCIDAGTLDLPSGVNLPAYDLAGNPRIMGSAIDMGAYEFPDNAAPINLSIDEATLSWQIPPGFYPNSYNIYLNNIYKDNISPNNIEYTFPVLQSGISYTAGVSAVYHNTETAIIPLQFVYQPVNIEEDEINITPPPDYQLVNYPNPFNPITTFSFNLAERGDVDLSVYNIKGQKVNTIISAYLIKGDFTSTWNGRDETGRLVSSGEYIARLKVNGKEKAERKIILLK